MSASLDYLFNTLKRVYGREGAAAVLGNVRAESAYNPKNLQNSYEKKLGMNDETYTAAVDSGAYAETSFVHDSAGYGLSQWTHWSRKQNLINYVRTRGKSVGDLESQTSFLIWEIGEYGLTAQLSGSMSLRDKVALVLRKYERPADQSDANVDRRTGYAREILAAYPETPGSSPALKEIAVELREEAARLNALAEALEKEV